MVEGIKFAWNEEYVGKRLLWYPSEEENRTKPYSEKIWSKVETLPSQRLMEIQWEKLRNVINLAYERAEFYRKKWDEAGVNPSSIKSWDDIPKIPIVTKEDFQKNQRDFSPFGNAFIIPPSYQMRFWQTTGTTDEPRIWCETKEDWENGSYNFMRCLYGMGIKPGWRAFIAFGYPPFMAFWHSHAGAEMLGCQVVPKGSLPTIPWLELTRRLGLTAPSFLACTPTYAFRMTEMAQEKGMDLKELGIKILLLAGEPGGSVPATKKYLEEIWGAKIHDVMGSTETGGPIMATCSEQANLMEPSPHFVSDHYLLEILDPTTLQKARDEEGISCVTSLSNRSGMPAIRFLIGDWVKTDHSTKCPCGRSFPLIVGGVKSRFDDMIIIKGVNIYPSLIENSVRAIEGLTVEYRIKLGGTTPVVMVESKLKSSQERYRKLAKALEENLIRKTSLRFEVQLKDPGELPREEVKSKRIIK